MGWKRRIKESKGRQEAGEDRWMEARPEETHQEVTWEGEDDPKKESGGKRKKKPISWI